MKPPPTLRMPVYFLTAQLENQLYWSEALFFPELSRLAARPPLPPLRASLKRALKTLSALELARRQYPAGAILAVERHAVEVAPPRRTLWPGPFLLQFFAVIYRVAGAELWAAHLPELGVEVVSEDRTLLPEQIRQEVRAELMRSKRLGQPGALVMLQRWQSLRGLGAEIEVQGPVSGAPEGKEEGSQLSKLASPLHSRPLPAAFELESSVEELADRLAGAVGERGQNVLLVGPSGVGKTALLYELVRRRSAYQLGSTPFYETSGARLLLGEVAMGAWQKRCQTLLEEVSRRKAILHLGSLQELLESARHATNPYGIAGFLRPYLVSGKIQALAEATPEQLAYVEKEYPQLLEAFVPYRLEPASPTRTHSILSCLFPSLGAETLEAVVELHQRFSSLSACPGWAVRFLRGVRRRHAQASRAHALERFSAQTGLPLLFLEDSLPFQREQVLGWFRQRLHGQDAAVERVVDRLAAFKAALTRPGRPIASFLLVGPTGVGKTELARCLAEFVFQDRQRLTRLDMSEYSEAGSLSRLIGAGLETTGLLVGMVRDRPFQVLLFDELEKAHANFFDLLLQILGDARLSDASGRVADFSNCLILMTSNLGAERFQKGSLGLREQSQEFGFLEAVRAAFRPELLNRIDEVIPFRPLDPTTILHICRRELELLSWREGLRHRPVQLQIGPGVAEVLADKGYDKRYGARPLKRIIDSQLLGPLSARLNAYHERIPLTVHIGVTEGPKRSLRIEAYPQSTLEQALAGNERQRRAGQDISGMRRRYQRMLRGPVVTEMSNSKTRYERRHRLPWPGSPFLEKVHQLGPRVQDLEEQALCALDDPELFALLATERATMADELESLIVEAFARGDDDSHEGSGQVLLALYGERPELLLRLTRAYLSVLVSRRYQIRMERVGVKRGSLPLATDKEPLPHLDRSAVEAERLLAGGSPTADLGYLLEVRGPFSQPLLRGEAGIHLMIDRGVEHKLLVATSSAALTSGDADFPYSPPAYQPPADIHRKGSLTHPVQVRKYNLDEHQGHDPLVGMKSLRDGPPGEPLPGGKGAPRAWDRLLRLGSSPGLAVALEAYLVERLHLMAAEAVLL